MTTPYTDMYFTPPSTPQTNIGGNFATIGAISGVGAAISSIFAGQTQALAYKMQEAAMKEQSAQARAMAKLNNLKLTQKYNDTAANQAVMFASQGRSFSSGSIQNIMRRDAEKFEWDKEYMKISGEYQSIGMLADAKGFGLSAEASKMSGYTTGLMKLANTYTDYKVIK